MKQQETVLDVDGPAQLQAVSTDASFLRVSVVLPVLDEPLSLRKTIDILLAENAADLAEILILVCPRTTEGALAACRDLVREHGSLIRIRTQSRPFLGGAVRDAFDWAEGSHVLMMAADLETDPGTVKDLLAAARQGFDIVTATRWTESGGFHGYNPLKYRLNLLFQKSIGWLYGVSLSDLTYGFRVFKVEWVKRIAWEEFHHAFLLETILKPMRLGARIAEVPTVWRSRVEGISHNPLRQHLGYFRIALKTRLRRKEALLVSRPS
jgi:glycosyltransferase involved in cell wall biosynthesis